MSRYVALLRAMNVGDTGKLPMADLRAMCEQIGFGDVRTDIGRGNVVFQTDMTFADAGTARHMNTLRKLVEMAGEYGQDPLNLNRRPFGFDELSL